ncbi:MAG: DUF4214 domain-containing protein [Noviherbaspirillum sp.]
MRDIASQFFLSAEARQAYGAMSNAQRVDTLYKLALQRTGSGAELAAWSRQLDSGHQSRAARVCRFGGKNRIGRCHQHLNRDALIGIASFPAREVPSGTLSLT